MLGTKHRRWMASMIFAFSDFLLEILLRSRNISTSACRSKKKKNKTDKTCGDVTMDEQLFFGFCGEGLTV